MAQKCKIWATQ